VRYIDDLNRGLDAVGIRTRQPVFLMQFERRRECRSQRRSPGAKTVHTPALRAPPAGRPGGRALSGRPRSETSKGRGLVTLDMGRGPAADIAFIECGAPLEVHRRRHRPAGRFERGRRSNLTTISAGGRFRSRRFDGPRSPHRRADQRRRRSGAGLLWPPAGTQPTVTDADLVCGFLNPDLFPGRRPKGSTSGRAQESLAEVRCGSAAHERCSKPAAGIRRIVDIRMADEVRGVRSEARRRSHGVSRLLSVWRRRRGSTQRRVAEELGMTHILVPPRPGRVSRRWGSSAPTVVHDYIALGKLRPALAARLPIMPRRCSRALETKGARADIETEGFGLRRAPLLARARSALMPEPGLRTGGTPLDGPVLMGVCPPATPRLPSGRVSTSAMPQIHGSQRQRQAGRDRGAIGCACRIEVPKFEPP